MYKDIHAVMAAQQDLVEVLARFDATIVKLAPGRVRAEDGRRVADGLFRDLRGTTITAVRASGRALRAALRP